MLAGTRAQAQAALGGEDAINAFTEFRDLVNRADREDRHKKLEHALGEMQKVKEIRFQPLAPLEKTKNLPRVKR